MDEKLKDILDFFEQSSGLKTTARYVRLKNNEQESSAAHSWQLSLMAPIIIDFLKLNLDVAKAVNLAIVHDLPEAITGDIDAVKVADNIISKEQKQTLEKNAISKLSAILPDQLGKINFSLWSEYEEAKTAEARFIKALDKLETTFQMARTCLNCDRPDFLVTYPDKAVRNFPELLPLLKAVKLRLKTGFQESGLEWKEEFNYGLD
ncbi:MAG: HD domain-containing protein [Patescibacteria group bacterium]|nr:HD domain-containing protein [Patescibacteria group bacterium]MCL5262084.1 HD domain-containing protein [Patescibacteria group bacterium]